MTHCRRLSLIVCTLVVLLSACAAGSVAPDTRPSGGSGPAAALRLAGVIGDGMVLQRDVPIRMWGWGAPGEAVEFEFRGQRVGARADAQGRFEATLAAAPAGGPHGLTLRGAATTLHLADLWIGEVWVASGQSNMEWALRDAQGGEQEVAAAATGALPIRHLKVAHRASLTPQADIATARWQGVTPASAGEVSAVGHFFARALQRELGVPIGIVNATWGGSDVETWTSPRAAAADPDLAPVMRELPPDAAAFAARWQQRQRAVMQRWQGDPAAADAEPARWSDPAHDDAAWRSLNVPQTWEEQGLPGFDGHVWYRRALDLDPAQAVGTATLHLGMIDDCDATWVNGRRVGGLCQWDTKREYALAPGVLRPGRNVIAVRVTDTGGGGGFHGEAAAVRLETAAGTIALAGPWRARVEAPYERVADLHANDAPTLAFNGMLHPLLGLPMRGVIWYQGESNVPRAARYAQAFPALIRDWRAQWRNPGPADWPFYFVQLASFRPLAENRLDVSSDWAELREAQRLTVQAVPATGMAVTIDVGDADDIHPRNKHAVGERLARLALRQVHGRAVLDSGPRLLGSQVEDGRIVLRFDPADGELAVRGGGELRGFAIADAGRRFVPARARIDGDRVIVWHEAVPDPRAVRYGWVANASEANLVNREGLPASPLRTDDWPWSTRDVRYLP